MAKENAKKVRGRRRSLWRRFRRSRAAVVGLGIILALVLGAVFAGAIAPYQPDQPNLKARLVHPSPQHLFGTDQLGRDVFSRVLYAGRVSLSVATVAVLIVISLGVFVGAVAGYAGGLVDTILMRLTDVILAFPTFFLMLGIVALFGRSIPVLILVIGLTSWPTTARIVRSEYLSWKEREFVLAARATGTSRTRILFRHILPNVMGSVLVIATLQVAWAILAEAGLSFIGLGVQPPTASLGNMVADGRSYLREAPWVTLMPGLVVFLCVMSFNLIGDALRDAFDPKMDIRG
ncbi:MAG TPA: ABC transporter permease [Bacillota bacterium]|jgi:peptide/nickel transport system permease protein